VSPEETATFLVHNDTLTQSSEFFQKACSDTWSKQNKVVSPVQSVHAYDGMKRYIHWLYTGTIPLQDIHQQNLPDKFQQVMGDTLARQYVSSAALLDVPFKKAVMEEILHRLDEDELGFVEATTGYLWSHVPETDKIRRLLVDCHAASTLNEGWWTEGQGVDPAGLLLRAGPLRDRDGEP
jgi:hypothetical protein